MANNGTYSEKKKVLNNLINSLNSTGVSVSSLKRSIDQNTKVCGDILSKLNTYTDKPSRGYSSGDLKESNSKSGVMDSRDFIETLEDFLSNTEKHLSSIARDVKDIKNQSLRSENDPNEPNDRRSPTPVPEDPNSRESMSRFMTAFLSMAIVRRLLGSMQQQLDSTMKGTVSIQKLAGLTSEEAYNSKEVINELYKGSQILRSSDEWVRLSEIGAAINVDNIDRLLTYSKATALATEGLGLSAGTIAETLYTIEKRGTFTSAQLEEVTDIIHGYSHSDATGNLSADELAKYIQTVGELIGAISKSEDDRVSQVEDLSRVIAGMEEIGMNDEFVSGILGYMKNLFDKNIASLTSEDFDALVRAGMSYEDIEAYKASGDFAGAFEQFLYGTEEYFQKNSDIEELRAQFLRLLGVEETVANKNAFKSSNVAGTIAGITPSSNDIEDLVEDQSVDVTNKLLTQIDNKVADITDWLAEKGIGSDTLGIVTDTVTAAGGFMLGKKLLGMLGRGSTGATNGISNAAGSVSGAANVADDIVSSAGRFSSALGKVGKVLGIAGIVLEAGVTTYNTVDDISEGDYRGAAEEAGSGIGTIGGGYAGATGGAALGTAIFPGVGTVIGGIIGGVAGAIAGDKFGETSGGFLYDLFSDDDEEGSTGGEIAGKAPSKLPPLAETGELTPEMIKEIFGNDYIGSFAEGTPYLPKDGVVFAHEGEAIVPAQYNPYNTVFRNKDSDNERLISTLLEIKNLITMSMQEASDRYEDMKMNNKVSESKSFAVSKGLTTLGGQISNAASSLLGGFI